MKTFNVLPSSPDFQNLTNDQIEFIIEQMNIDYKERNHKGFNADLGAYDYDDGWFTSDIEDFEPLVAGHDEADIVRQAAALYEDAPTDVNRTLYLQEVDQKIASDLKAMKLENDKLVAKGVDKWVVGSTPIPNEKQVEDEAALDIQNQIHQLDEELALEDKSPDSSAENLK